MTLHTIGTQKVCLAQYQPGSGFEYNIKQDCFDKSINFVSLDANQLISSNVSKKDNTLYMGDSFPEVNGKTFWVISGMFNLEKSQQESLFEKLKEKIQNTDLGIAVTTVYLDEISPEILKECTLYVSTQQNRLLPGFVDSGRSLKDAINTVRVKNEISSSRDNKI